MLILSHCLADLGDDSWTTWLNECSVLFLEKQVLELPLPGCFVKADDFSVLQPLLKYNFEIRLLSFVMLSFRVLMKLRYKLSRSDQGSSQHAQQGKYTYLLNLKVRKEGTQQVEVGQPLHEASGVLVTRHLKVCGFFCYVHNVHMPIYMCIYFL